VDLLFFISSIISCGKDKTLKILEIQLFVLPNSLPISSSVLLNSSLYLFIAIAVSIISKSSLCRFSIKEIEANVLSSTFLIILALMFSLPNNLCASTLLCPAII